MNTNPSPSARPATGPDAGAARDAAAVVAAGFAPPAHAQAAHVRPAAGRRTAPADRSRAGVRAAGLALVATLAAWLPGAAAAASPAERDTPRRIALDVRPAPAPAAGPLAAWHRRYLPHAAPVRAAMKRLLAARRVADPTDYKRRYRQACRSLAETLGPFGDPERRDALYPAAEADPAAHYHLRRAYAELAAAAAAGADGRYEAAELAFADAARWFRQAARVLERYGLEP